MEAGNQLPTETNNVVEENLPTPRVEKSLEANGAAPSTLSRFHWEDFFFKCRCELAVYAWRDLRSKITNETFSDISSFADKVFKDFDEIQFIEKVNISYPKQRFEQYLEKIRKFEELNSKLSFKPLKVQHLTTLRKLKEKCDKMKVLENTALSKHQSINEEL